MRPGPSRSYQRLRLAHYAAAAPCRDYNEAWTSQAAAARHAAKKRCILGFLWKTPDEQLFDRGRIGICGGQLVNLLPEFAAALIRAFDIGADPYLLLVEQRRPRLLEAVAVPFQDRVGRILAFDLHLRCKIDARRESHKIECIRHDSGFVEIVHAPYPASIVVAPSPEILEVNIADAEGSRRLVKLRADLLDAPSPAIIRRPQEDERILAHPFVLSGEIVFGHGALGAKPVFVVLGIFKNGQAMPPTIA